jgi:hypothetical protein
VEDKQARLLTWLAVLLTILVAAIVLIERGGDGGPDEGPDGEHPRLAEGVEEADIFRLVVSTPGAAAVTLLRDEQGRWGITEPQMLDADQDAVTDIVRKLVTLRCEEIVAEEHSEQFGLRPPALSITAEVEGGSPIAVLVGADAPVGSVSYVDCGEGSVRLASDNLGALEATVDGLRAKDIARLGAPDKIAVFGGQDELLWPSVSKTNGRWMTDDGRAVDAAAVNRFVEQIDQLRAVRFGAPAPAPPITTISIVDNGEETIIQVGDDGAIVATGLSEPVWAQVDPEELIPTLKQLLSQGLFSQDGGRDQIDVKNMASGAEHSATFQEGQWSQTWAVNAVDSPVQRDNLAERCGAHTHEVVLTDAQGEKQMALLSIGGAEGEACARDVPGGAAFVLTEQIARAIQTLP